MYDLLSYVMADGVFFLSWFTFALFPIKMLGIWPIKSEFDDVLFNSTQWYTSVEKTKYNKIEWMQTQGKKNGVYVCNVYSIHSDSTVYE